ncbi:MAG: hypothetical protein IJZ89_08285 [Clostridia bacterium]|nr:hypothetical protein [Clostridia bacterium]
MKNTVRILSVILTLILAMALFTACGEEPDGGKVSTIEGAEIAEDGLPILHVTEIKNIADYKLIRSENASQAVIDAFSALRTALSDFCGSQIKPGTDFDTAAQYEILVGETNRTESKNANSDLTEKEYLIKMEGDKIVIAGGSDDSLISAINEFTEYFLTDGKVLVPTGAGLLYSPNYEFDKISIDGKDISEFKIYAVQPNCSARLSENIDLIYSGQKVEIAEELKEGEGPYIVLDAVSLDYTSYKAEVKDGNLYVSGSFKSCIEFLDYYVKKGDKDVNITGTIEGKLDAPVLYDKAQLMSVLQTVYNGENVILGEQINHKEMPAETLSKFSKATGANPSILGLDLACYGMELPTATPEEISEIFCELVEYAEGGGIITISSHFANPTGNWGDQAMVRGQLGGKEAWDQLLTEGSELNTIFTEEVVLDGEFLKAFNDLGLSIIWRPFHEINSGWFWYSIAESGKTLDAEYAVRLWTYVYDIYAEIGLDQLVWEYSPNNDNSWISVEYCYPGDEYCDIVGLDWYTDGGYEIDGKGKSYSKLMNYEKITNICEFGIGGPLEKNNRTEQELTFSCMDFTSLVQTIMNDGYKIGYVLTWTSRDSVDWWGEGEKMMQTGVFLSQRDMLSLFDAERSK